MTQETCEDCGEKVGRRYVWKQDPKTGQYSRILVCEACKISYDYSNDSKHSE